MLLFTNFIVELFSYQYGIRIPDTIGFWQQEKRFVVYVQVKKMRRFQIILEFFIGPVCITLVSFKQNIRFAKSDIYLFFKRCITLIDHRRKQVPKSYH